MNALIFPPGLCRPSRSTKCERITFGAGRYAITAFGEKWRPIVTEALAVRVTGETSGTYDDDPEGRAEDCIAFTDMVVREGLALPV